MEDPASQQPTRTAISASYIYETDSSLMSSAATGLGHVTSHHTTPSTTTAWYQGISTIQRDIIDEATSTFTLGTSVSTLVTSELVTCSFFSDESRFQLFRADGRTRIYRCAGERTAPCCVQETVPFGRGSVMVLGGICGQQRTDIIIIDGNLTALRYINWVLRPVLLPFLQHQLRLVSTGQCQTSHSSCGATALRRKQRQCFATDRTMGSSWQSNSLCPSPPMNREREREKKKSFI